MAGKALNRVYQLAEGERVLLAGASKAVAERTRDGDEIVEFMVGVMRGRRYRWPELHPKELPGLAIRPTPALRASAAEWLAERLWGRPATVNWSPGDGPPPIDGLAEALQFTPQESAFLAEARALQLRLAQEAADAGDALDRSVIPDVGTVSPQP